MGFFSSIGKVFKKVAAPVAGVLGGVLGGPGGAVAGATMADAVWNGGSSGSGSDWQKSAYNDQMAFAREQFDFNKQYIQNQMQWRVADAQKAGLHPMAALGLNGASFSGVSMPSIPNIQDSTYDPVELGQSIAYASAKAKTNEQQEQAFLLSQSLGAEQIKGVQLDNELKQLEILSLVSRLTQATPAAPNLNGGRNLIGGQNDAPVGNSFTAGTSPLLSLSRVGNTLMGHINPDISDSLTEDMIRNQLANLNAEFQAGRITPEVYAHLTKQERDLIKKGDLVLEYSFPSTWRLRYTSRMRPKYSNDNREVSGKLNSYHMKY